MNEIVQILALLVFGLIVGFIIGSLATQTMHNHERTTNLARLDTDVVEDDETAFGDYDVSAEYHALLTKKQRLIDIIRMM